MPRDYALKIWTTLRIFLEAVGESENKWASQFWLLIPFDPESLERLWSSGPPEDANKKKDLDFSENTATAFLQKTFQVRFCVPPPVVTDWHAYLTKQFSQALPEHKEEDFDRALRVFNIWCRDRTPPTPRQLKLLVNDIGALHRQWQHQFPLEHMAYFVILKYRNMNVVSQLRNRQLPEPEYQMHLRANADEDLAALAFNAEPDKARVLLLRGPIQSALQKGESDELNALATGHSGFHIVFEEWLDDSPGNMGNDTSGLTNSGRAIQDSGVESVPSCKHLQDPIGRFAKRALEVLQVGELSSETALGAGALVRLSRSSDAAGGLLKSMFRHSPTNDDEAAPSESALEWAKVLIEILVVLDDRTISKITESGVTIRTHRAGFLAACGGFADDKKRTERFWPLLRSTESANSILAEIAPSAGHTDWPGERSRLFPLLLAAPSIYPWDEFVTRSKKFLIQVKPAIAPESISSVLDALWRLDNMGNAIGLVKELAGLGMLHHHLHTSLKASADKACTELLFSILAFHDGATAPTEVGNSAAGFEKLKGILESVNDESKMVFEFVNYTANRPSVKLVDKLLEGVAWSGALIRACLRVVLDGKWQPGFISCDLLFAHWANLKRVFPKNVDYLESLKKLDEHLNIFDHAMTKRHFNNDAEFYDDLWGIAGDQLPSYAKWCETRLIDLTESSWLDAIKTQSPILRILENVRNNNDAFRLKQTLLDAIRIIAKDVLNDATLADDLEQSWPVVLSTLHDDQRKVLREHLIDGLKTKPDAGVDFWRLFENELLEGESFTRDQEIVRLILIPIVKSENVAAIRWAGKLLEQNANLLRQFLKHQVSEFKDRLKNRTQLPDLSDDLRSALETLSETAGVPIVRPSDDDQAENGETTESQPDSKKSSDK